MENNITPPLSPADENLIMRHKDIISSPVKIRLVRSDDDAGVQMNQFCSQLEKLLPNITIKREPADDDLPGIHVSDNIHFMMAPKGACLEAFLLSLIGREALASQDMGINASGVDKRIHLPGVLKIYVTETCPICHKTVPKGLFLAGAAPMKIAVRIIDAGMFPTLAEKDKIRSVPTTIIDDTFRFNGDFPITELVEMIAERDPVQLGYDTLKKMIADGDAARVASLMDEFDTVIPAFTDLLTAEKWHERLGAMVTFEYLAEKNAVLAQRVLDLLWQRFDSLDTAVMGDMLHLVGVLNQSGQIFRLQSVLKGAYPDTVKKVAQEIIEALPDQ